MTITRLPKILTKTDLGISGKNGAEILLNKDSVNSFFADLPINISINFIDLETNEQLPLTKKIEASVKFTSPILKRYYDRHHAQEGDLLELFIIEDDEKKEYYLKITSLNVLIFKQNKTNREYYSISEEKLKNFMNTSSTKDVKINADKQEILTIKTIALHKLRTDALSEIQHYQLLFSSGEKLRDDKIAINLNTFNFMNIIDLEKISEEQLKDNQIPNHRREYILNHLCYKENTTMTPNITIANIRPSARLINTIGRDLIKDVYAAIIELVKNSYDADSPSAKIILSYNEETQLLRTIVKDAGHGMSLQTILDIWLVPATSDKLFRKMSPKGRLLQGKKGIGRYAAGILGNLLLLETTDQNQETSKIMIDFDDFLESKYLSDIDILIETGSNNYQPGVTIEATSSNISRDAVIDLWNSRQLENLELELKKLKSPLIKNIDDPFEISLEYQNFPIIDETKKVTYRNEIIKIAPLPIIDYYDYRIHGKIDNQGNATLFYNNQNLSHIIEEKICIKLPLDENQKYCGDIDIDFRVYDRDPDSIDNLINRGLKQFSIGKLEAKKLLDNMYGVSIYRDIFRLRPYGNQDFDWLDLDKDRVQNPSFAIGMNQIIGFINIEEEEESNLHEKSARDGLIENNEYFGLHKMIKTVLQQILQPKRFAFRQQIGRGRKAKNISEKIDSLFDFESIETKIKAMNLNLENTTTILKIIDTERKSKENDLKEIKNTIAIYQGQVTLGKMTDVLLHEGRKSLRYLNEQIPRINRWNKNFLEKPSSELKQNIENKHNTILSHLKDLSLLFKRIEPFSKGNLPNKTNTNIYSAIQKAYGVFELQIKDLDIKFINRTNQDLEIYGREYDLYMAFVNFIENSIFWLKKKNDGHKIIEIHSEENEKGILIELYDNGPGINAEYAHLVFDPGFSLKEGGTGLGMSIAAESLKRSGGRVSIGAPEKEGTVLYIEFIK